MAPKPPKKPQKQHYITKSYMKQWADSSDMVGVVCLYHRDRALVSPKGLHRMRDLSSPEQEKHWSRDEDEAKNTLDGLTEALGSSGDSWPAAEAHLSVREHFDALVDFVALHHARSLVVPLRQLLDSRGTVDSAESEATIRARSEAVKNQYNKGGIEITVYPQATPVALGAIPVFDSEDWGARPPGTGRFMMPLTPRAMICGTPDWESGRVSVAPGSLDFESLLWFQLGGAPGLISSPYLVCEPSALERIANTALRLTEGGNWHWNAIDNRIALCGDSAPGPLRADWHQRTTRHTRNQATSADPTTTYSMRRKLQAISTKDARKIQDDLDELGVQVCACKQHRNNPEVSTLWKTTMPEAVCYEIRRQRNTRSERLTTASG